MVGMVPVLVRVREAASGLGFTVRVPTSPIAPALTVSLLVEPGYLGALEIVNIFLGRTSRAVPGQVACLVRVRGT